MPTDEFMASTDFPSFMQKMTTLLYWTPIMEVFSVLATVVSKLSFCITLLRLVVERWQKIAVWFLATTCTVAAIGIMVITHFQCSYELLPTPQLKENKHCIVAEIVHKYDVFICAYQAFMVSDSITAA